MGWVMRWGVCAELRSSMASAGQAGALVLLGLILTVGDPWNAFAQTLRSGALRPETARGEENALPDAPIVASAVASTAEAADERDRPVASGATLPEASAMQKFIQPGQMAPALKAGDKILFGLHNTATPFEAAGWIASAGWEQFSNGSPNYGAGAMAFGQRVGAAALRNASEGVFSDAIMANVTHEDPRYYVLGPGHNPIRRLAYAVSRTVVTRTDTGGATPNVAMVGGNLGGALLTNAYYPPANRGTEQTLETFGKSLAASAFGFTLREFWGGVRARLHGPGLR